MTATEQARADALADAETLRLALPSPRRHALWSLRGRATRALSEPQRVAYGCARLAARAAFGLVPALRGDR